MLGYILAAILVIYFFFFWPHFENLPPRSARIRRQRLAGKFGLHDKPSVGRIYLTDCQKNELINCINYTDNATFKKISNSNYFYLVESRRSILSLYCAINKPKEYVDFDKLKEPNFIKIQISEHLLIRFLTELNPLRKV